jgi:hypothetical protein
MSMFVLKSVQALGASRKSRAFGNSGSGALRICRQSNPQRPLPGRSGSGILSQQDDVTALLIVSRGVPACCPQSSPLPSASSAVFLDQWWKSTAENAEEQRDCERATYFDLTTESSDCLTGERSG